MKDAASSVVGPLRRSKRIRDALLTTAPLSPKSKRTQEILKSIFEAPVFPVPQYTEAHLKPDSEILTTVRTLALPANQVHTLPPPSVPPVPQFILNLPGGGVFGKLTYVDNGDILDCNERGSIVTRIPWDIELISNMKSDALFILLVANNSAFMELADVRFYDRFPCIIVSAGGPADFLFKLKRDLNLPVLALFDCDPNWLKMLSFYGIGFNGIKWLGIRPTDFEKYKMGDKLTLPMTKKDIKIVKDLLESDFFKQNPNWIQELKVMLSYKRKADIEYLCRFGFNYLTGVFLPMKLQDQDWI